VSVILRGIVNTDVENQALLISKVCMGSIYSACTILGISSKNSVVLYNLLHRIFGPWLSHMDANATHLFIVFCVVVVVVVADMSIFCVS